MNTLREEAIIQLIQSRLLADRRTSAQTIDVIIEDGDIFLVGNCDSEETKQAAVNIVDGIYGIKVVVDQLHVRTMNVLVCT